MAKCYGLRAFTVGSCLLFEEKTKSDMHKKRNHWCIPIHRKNTTLHFKGFVLTKHITDSHDILTIPLANTIRFNDFKAFTALNRNLQYDRHHVNYIMFSFLLILCYCFFFFCLHTIFYSILFLPPEKAMSFEKPTIHANIYWQIIRKPNSFCVVWECVWKIYSYIVLMYERSLKF